jgi:hypothetical protein
MKRKENVSNSTCFLMTVLSGYFLLIVHIFTLIYVPAGFTLSSTWIVTLSAQRAYLIYRPMQARAFFSDRTLHWKVVCGIIVMSAVWSIPGANTMVKNEVRSEDAGANLCKLKNCVSLYQGTKVYAVYLLIDSFLSSWIPFFIIFASNIAILVKIMSASRVRPGLHCSSQLDGQARMRDLQ